MFRLVPASRAHQSKTHQNKAKQSEFWQFSRVFSDILASGRGSTRMSACPQRRLRPQVIRIRAFADYQSAIQPRRDVGALFIRSKAVTGTERTREKA
jgi:hypothetical protein